MSRSAVIVARPVSRSRTRPSKPVARDAGRLRWQAYERFQQQPRLEAEGLLQTAPQRGLQIATIDVKLVRNAFQLRAIIEREAAAQFALTATDSELAALETAHRDVVAKARHGITPALLDAAQAIDWGLHDRMVDAHLTHARSRALGL